MKEILLTSSVLIAALLVLRRLFRKTVSRRLQYALWGLVLVRLLLPIQLPAVEHNVLTAAEPVRQTVTAQIELPQMYVPVERAPLEQHPEAQDSIYKLPPTFSGGWMVENSTTAVKYRQLTATDVLRYLWYAGMAVMTAWFLLSNLRFYRTLRKNRTPYPVEGYRYPIYLADCLPSPCLFGLLRPAVYLTPAAVASDDTLRHVLAHETTHARHLDPLWSLLRCVCLVVYWFDPLVWAAALISRKDCELACDEGAIKRLGEAERIPYGQTLLRLIPLAKHPGSPLLSATTMTAGKKELKERITRIAENRRTVGVALLAVLTAVALICAATFTGAKTHGEPLTQDELNDYTALLNVTSYTMMGRQFLTSTYETPEDIDLYQLLYNGKNPADECTPEERQILVDTYLNSENPGVDLTKITAENVDRILQNYIGLSLSETDARNMGSFYYLADYNAYYHFHGDTNAVSYVRFYAGERQGDEVSLYYRAEPFALADTLGSEQEVWAKVTIRPAEDFEETRNYTFRSNQLCDRPDDLLGEIRTLTGEELTFFNEEFFNNDTSADGTVTVNYHNQFLTCLYASPHDISLYNLLYCGIGSNETLSEDELLKVGSLDGEGMIICPVDKMSTAAIDAFLLENTGSPPTEAQKSELEACFTYLPEYDAYYNSHGDTNYYSGVRFTGGQRVGDYIHLYYYDHYYGGGYKCLTLLDRGEGNYWFMANQLADSAVTPTVYPEEEPWLTLPLDAISPTLPLEMRLERHADDCAQRGDGLWAEADPSTPAYSVRPYLSTDGNLYLAVVRSGTLKMGEIIDWEADVFFTVPQRGLNNTVDNVALFFFDDLLGYEYGGFTFTYSDYITGGPGQGGYVGTVTDYYVIDSVGTPSLIARAYGSCADIDMDGDGEKELCAISGASGQVFFRRGGHIYEADVKTLLTEAWPELQYWEGGLCDYNYRHMAVTGSVKMPEWGDGSASFTRYVYLAEESLLVYKPTEETVTDHVVGTPNVPDDVLAAAKATVLADYQTRKSDNWLQEAGLDDWRIEALTYEAIYDYPGGSIWVYNINYEFHAQNPGKVALAGGSYIKEDAWCMIGYPSCTYLFFLDEKNGERSFLEARMINDTVPGTDMFDAEMAEWAVELGLSTVENTTGQQLLNQLYNSPSQFISKLSLMEEAEQRTVCRQLWEYQKTSGSYEKSLYILAIQTLHWISSHSFDDQEAAAFDIFLQEAHSDEAAAQVQTILNALTAEGPITLTRYDLDGKEYSFALDPTGSVTAARAAAFSDSFFWADTGIQSISMQDHLSRLTLTSAKGDITLKVFETLEQVYCTYQGRTYVFLGAGQGTGYDGDRTYTYFRKWFDDAENAAIFTEYSAMLDELFVKESERPREQITEFWLDELGKAAVDRITRESRYACEQTEVCDVTVSDTPLSDVMDREAQLANAEHFYFTCRWTFTPEGARAQRFASVFARADGQPDRGVDGTYTVAWAGVIAKVNGRWCCYGLESW